MAITKTVFDVVKDSIKPYIDSQNATLSNEVDTLSNLVEGATEITTKSFSPVIAVNDALPVNAVDVSAKIEPIQAGSGTPSPSNVRAISGRTEITVTRAGKNLCPSIPNGTYSYGTNGSVTVVNNADGSMTYNQTADSGSVWFTYTLASNVVLKAGSYRIIQNASIYNDGSAITIKNVSSSANIVDTRYTKNTTFTLEDDTLVNIVFSQYKESSNVTLKLALFYGTDNSIADFEPYTGNDYTIQLGDTYYGGTLDVTTGVLTVDRGYAEFDGSNDENWGWASNNSLFGISVDNAFIVDNTTQGNKYTLNNLFPDVSWAGKTDAGSVGLIWGSSTIFLKYSALGSAVSDLKSFLASNPLQVVYKLATPITIQLTPQEIQMLQGNNTIFTDSGDTSIQYYANGVKNLEASVSAIQNDTNDLKALTAIFGTFENGTTASKPYVQGDYFVKNNKMCKAKTSIAKGATLTLNTNYEEKTLAEILKTIETA